MPNEITDQEIQREMDTLRLLRRRSASSSGPGALPLDPDLPPSTASSEHHPLPHSPASSSGPHTPDAFDSLQQFWVPAHIHPELAPGEFRAFLKAHTHPDPGMVDEDQPIMGAGSPGMGLANIKRGPSLLSRGPSTSSQFQPNNAAGGLGRKRSMLSKQYHPRANDKVEDEAPPVPSLTGANSHRTSLYGGGLTLEDLQKLEHLADEAAMSEDPATMRHLLRQSMSLRPGGDLPKGDEPILGDDADAPIFLPSPGSILQRTARTKIRKASLAGDGGGHRFAATRKGRTTAAPQYDAYDEDSDPRNRSHGSDESERSSEEINSGVFASSQESHDDVDDSREEFYDAREGEGAWDRRPSDESVDEGMIFDAYASRGDTSRSSSVSSTGDSRDPSPEPSESDHYSPSQSSLPTLGKIETNFEWPPHGEQTQDDQRTPTQESVLDPMRHSIPMSVSPQPTSPSSPSSPVSSATSTHRTPQLPPGMAPPATSSIPPGMAQRTNSTPVSLTSPTSERPKIERAGSSIPAREKEKEKEKRGGLFSRGKKEKEKEKEKDAKKKSLGKSSDKKEKEKDGFLGSLFGGKKKQEDSPVASFSAAGPAAAAALLGSSKSAKSLGLIPMNGQTHSPTSPGFSNFSRYPIHVERAVYRLSHIKLANPRRPLYEQVLISNLMFWYLSVINRTQTPEEKKAPPPVAAAVDMADKEAAEAKKAQAQATPKPTPVTATVPEPAPSQKRTGLVKPERSRTKPAASVKPPEYGMQNVQVNKEIQQRVISGGGPPRPVATPPPASPSAQHRGLPETAMPQQGPPSPSGDRARSPPQPQQSHPPQPTSGGPLQPQLSHPPRPMLGHPMPNINPRELQGPPRGPPASSYGPPPPMAQPQPHPPQSQRQASPGPSQAPQRRPEDRDPASYAPQQRRPEGSPSAPYPHAGPQPGQVFQYPGQGGVPGGVQPGQVFPGQLYTPQPGSAYRPPQPGQVFHHPPYNGPPRGPPPPGARPPNGPPAGWDGQQRLPLGAFPREQLEGHPPQRRVASAESYDPRRPHPGNIITSDYPAPYPGAAPSPTRSEGGGYYQTPRPGAPHAGEPFNPYTRPPGGGPPPGQQVRRQVSSDDGQSQRYARGSPVGTYPGGPR